MYPPIPLKEVAEFLGYLVVIWSAFRAAKRWAVPHLKKWTGSTKHAELTKRVDVLAAKIFLIINLRGDAIYVCKPTGYNVWASESLCRMLGLSRDAIAGNGWASAITEEDRVRALAKWKECVRTRTPYTDTYTVVVNGERKLVETKAYEYVNELDEVVLYVGCVIECKPKKLT